MKHFDDWVLKVWLFAMTFLLECPDGCVDPANGVALEAPILRKLAGT